MANGFSTKRISNGEFACYWNGEETGDQIINGSLGMSGRETQNMYGVIWKGGKTVWIGSLASAKKTAEHGIKVRMQNNAKNAVADTFRKASEIKWEPA